MKSGSPRQPSSRPPFRRDWLGIRFSSWNAGFQLEKRIRKTTFITAPFQERLAGDPFFELECRIPARKADPQDNLHHGPLSGGIGRGSAFQAGMPDSSSNHGPLFRRDWLGSAWIPARKADPQDNLHHGPLSGGIGRGSAFRAGMPDSSLKSGSPRRPSSRPSFQERLAGAGMPDSSSKSGSPRQPSSFQEGLAGVPLLELECRIPA